MHVVKAKRRLLVLAADEDVEDDEEKGDARYCPNTAVECCVVSKDVGWLHTGITVNSSGWGSIVLGRIFNFLASRG
jgi:hypothetical protein